MDTTTFIALLGALGIGGMINQWLGNSRARRDSRAAVLAALADVEQARWAPAPHTDWRDAVRHFQAAALVAGLPRRAVGEYLVIAQAARWSSSQSAESNPAAPEESLGAIDSDLADAAREAASAIAEAAWHGPARRKWTSKKRAAKVSVALEGVAGVGSLKNLEQSRKYGGW